MTVGTFPSLWDAPFALHELPGDCGPLSAWMVLRHFGRRVAARRVIEACRHTEEHGTFMIALAVGLRELGLSVRFHSEPDPEKQAIEEPCYALAESIGVEVRGALELPDLLAEIGEDRVAIVLFDADGVDAHISPLTGSDGARLLLPNTAGGVMDIADFETAWRAPGILRQCVLVSRG